MINTGTYAKSKSSGTGGSGGSGGGSSVVNNYYGKFTPFYIWGNYCDGTSDINGNIKASNSNITVKNATVKDTLTANIAEILSAYTDYIHSVQAEFGSLDVSGNTSLKNTTIDGNEGITGDLSVSGTTDLKGDLNVSGDTRVDYLYSNNINNSDTIKTKNLEVTGQAHFWELIIDKIKAAGGAVLFTPCDGFEAEIVEASENGYKLYWRSEDDNGKATMSMWQVNDQAVCRNFNAATVGTSYNVSNKYYWCLVTAVDDNKPVEKEVSGETHNYHFIEISTSDYDGTVNPEIGDEVVMLGYRGTDDASRQSAIYISAYKSIDQGLTAPLFAEYKGINDFDLASHRYSYIDSTGAHFRGSFSVSDGTTIEDYIDGQIEEKTVEFRIDIDGLTSRVSKTSNPNILPSNGWKDQEAKAILQEDDEEYNLSSSTEAAGSEENLQAFPPTIYLNSGDYTMSVYSHSKFNDISYGYEKNVLNQVLTTETQVNKTDEWHEYPRSIMTFEAPIDGYYHLGITQMNSDYSGDTPYIGDTDSYREKTYLTLTADKSSAYEEIGTIQLTATVTPSRYNGKITYYSSNSNIATVDSNGKVSCVSAGKFKIVANAERKVVGKQIFLESSAEIELESLALDEVTPTLVLNMPDNPLTKGESYQLSTTVSPTAYNGKIKYSTSDNTIASITSTGLLTVKDYGVFNVYVTNEEWIDVDTHIKYISTSVSQYAYADGTEQDTKLTFTANDTYFSPERSYKTTVKVVPDGYPGVIQYSSSDETIATINNYGVITTQEVGNVTFTATAPEITEKGLTWKSSTGALSINVTESFEIMASFPVANTIQMTGLYNNSTNVTTSVTWSLSCDTSIASINNSGLIYIGALAENDAITVTGTYKNITQKLDISVTYQKMSDSPNPEQITYTTTDGKIANMEVTSGFGANFVSNEYTSSGGVITFDGEISGVPENAFTEAWNLKTLELPPKTDYLCRDAVSSSSVKEIKLTNFKTTIHDNIYLYANYYVPHQALGVYSYDYIGISTSNVFSSVRYYDYYENNVLPLMTFNGGTSSFSGTVTTVGDATLLTTESHEHHHQNTTDYQTYYKLTYDKDITSLGNFDGINAVGIPLTVKTIPYHFYNSTSAAEDIVIPDSIETISAGAVGSYCTWLEHIDIGKNIKSIGNNPFPIDNTTQYIYCRATTPPSLGSLTHCYTDIYVPRESIGLYQTTGNWAWDGYEYHPIVENWIIDYETNDGNPINVTSIGWEYNLLSNVCTNGKGRLCFEGDITRIPNNAFESATNLTKITFPESVFEIGSNIFSNCDNLETFQCYPTKVPEISRKAFDNIGCSKFKIYVAPIAEGAYKTELADIYIGTESISNRIIAQQYEVETRQPLTITPSKNSEIYYTTVDGSTLGLESGITTFGATLTGDTYSDGYGVLSFDGPVTTVPENGFQWKYKVCSVSLPTSVTGLTKYACFDSELRYIKLNEGITTMGESALDAMDNLKELVLPDSLTSMDIYTIGRCPRLETLTIGPNLTTIQSIYQVPHLRKIICKATTPPTWSPYGDAAGFLPDTNKCKIFVPDDSVDAYNGTDIWKNYEIYPMSLLEDEDSVHIWPITNSFESTNNMAGWNNYETVSIAAFNGDKSCWVMSTNQPSFTLENVHKNCYYLRFFALNGNASTGSISVIITSIDENGDTETIRTITKDDISFTDWTQVETEFDLPNNVKYLNIKFSGDNVYIDDFYLIPTSQSVDIEWTGVDTITLSNGHSVSSPYHGYNCYVTTFPSGVTTVNRARFVANKWGGTFKGCVNLTSVDISELDLSNLCFDTLFNGCSSLKSITFPKKCFTSVLTTSYYAFNGCSSLETLDLGNSDYSNVTEITNTFAGCSSLKTLDLSKAKFSSKLVWVSDMFNGCSSLETLDLSNCEFGYASGNAKKHSQTVFTGCSSLKTIYMRNCSSSSISFIQTVLGYAGLRSQVTIVTE